MFNITPEYKLVLKHNQRPYSNIDKKTQLPTNKSFNEYSSKDLLLNKVNNKEKNTKKFYLNIHRKNSIEQKKLFYNKIYNKNYGNKDALGLSKFLSIEKKTRKSNMRTKEYSSSRLSSTTTFRKINLKSKSHHKTQEELKSYDYSYEKDKIKDNVGSYIAKIKNRKKVDKTMQINDEELKKIYNNSMTKRRPVSVSMLLNREKDIPKKIDIKPEEVNSDEIKVKNIFIIKFGYILDMFKKAISGSDWIRMDFRTTFINISTNLSKSFEIYNKLLLTKLSDENCLQSLYNFCEEIISWQKLAIEEIRHLKKENIYLTRRKEFLEKELNTKKEEIKELNNDIIKYDLNRVNKGKQDDSKAEKIKKDFINIESNYVNTIYQLQKERTELNILLGKNKKEKINTDELKNKIKKLREELAECKTIIFKNEFNQKSKDKLNNIYIDELSQKISDFDKEKEIWKEKEIKVTGEMINLKIKIERLNEIIKEKDNKIEELEKKIYENKINSFLDSNIKIHANTQFISEKKL